MNIINNLRTRLVRIEKSGNFIYLASVLNHLNRSINYYKKGGSDNQYYNDVIYRNNQIFEAILKELYYLHSNEENKSEYVSLGKIEKYLLSNNLLNVRVKNQITYYRENWRNDSAHNPNNIFTESEAFLSITNLIGLTHLILNKIEEVQQQIKTIKLTKNGISSVVDNPNLTTATIAVIKEFLQLKDKFLSNNEKESLMIGSLHGFMKSTFNKNIQIEREPNLDNKFPDFIISKEEDRILLEIKSLKNFQTEETMQNIFSLYLPTMSKYDITSLLILNINNSNINISDIGTISREENVNNKKYTITTIYDKKR